MLNFLIGIGMSAGSSLLGSLFGGNKKPPITQREVNFLETHDEPTSRYGEPIPLVYGKARVKGIYIAAQVPFDWERDDYFDPERREWQLTYIYYGNCGVMWCQTHDYHSSPTVERIWMNKTLYRENGNWKPELQTYWGRFPAVAHTDNWDNSSLDPRVGFLGSNHTAFRKSCYTSFNKLRLNNSNGGLFNSRYPNMEAEINTHGGGTPNLGGIIEDLMLQAGYQAHEFDVTELNDINVPGFVALPGRLSDRLGILQQCYFFEVVDTGAQLKFIKSFRATSSAYIPATDIGCREDGSEQPPLFEESETALEDLPTQIRIRFNDAHNYYEESVIDSFESNITGVKNIQEINTGLTLTESEALAIANKQLMVLMSQRRQYKFTVSARYGYLEAGDVIDVEQRGGTPTPMQITRINIKPSGLIDIQARSYDGLVYGIGWTIPASYTNTTLGAPGTTIDLGQLNALVNSVTSADGTITYVEGVDYTFVDGVITILPGSSINGDIIVNWQGESEEPSPIDTTPATVGIYPFDIPHPSDNDAQGIYICSFGEGAILYVSTDGVEYTSVGGISVSTVATATNVLADHTGGVDNVGQLQFEMYTPNQFPSSGRVYYGAEILDYSSVTYDPVTRTGTLSGLTRGLRRTTSSGHPHSSPVESIFLLTGYKYTHPTTWADVGTTFYFKAVTRGQELGDVTASTVVYNGYSLYPIRPIIYDFSPRAGIVGSTVTIQGWGFTYATSATIGGIALDNIVISGTNNDQIGYLVGDIPDGATTGPITVVEDPDLHEQLGDAVTTADYVVAPKINWGDILGDIPDQTDIKGVLDVIQTRLSNLLLTVNGTDGGFNSAMSVAYGLGPTGILGDGTTGLSVDVDALQATVDGDGGSEGLTTKVTNLEADVEALQTDMTTHTHPQYATTTHSH